MANFIQMAQKAAQFKSKMQELQDRMKAAETAGSSGEGRVTCVMDGRFALKTLEIDDAVRAGDPVVMTALIIAAINDARDRAEQAMADETKKLMDDLGLPPGLGLPF